MDFMDFLECTYVNDLEFDSQFNTYPKESDDTAQASDIGDSNLKQEETWF